MGRPLYIWVEGEDDERFFRKLVVPLMANGRSYVEVVQYSQDTPQKRRHFLKSIESMGADVLWIADIDRAPCAAKRRQLITSRHRPLRTECVMVVVREIESWYLAGLNDASCQALGIRPLDDTDRVTKEQLRRLQPRRFIAPRDFMVEILKAYSIETAKRKNRYFRYFAEKHGL